MYDLKGSMQPFMMSGSPDYMQWMKDWTVDMVDVVIDQVDDNPNDKEAKSITGTLVSVISAGAVNRIADLKEVFLTKGTLFWKILKIRFV